MYIDNQRSLENDAVSTTGGYVTQHASSGSQATGLNFVFWKILLHMVLHVIFILHVFLACSTSLASAMFLHHVNFFVLPSFETMLLSWDF